MNSTRVSLKTLIKNVCPALHDKDFIARPLNELYDIIMHHVAISKSDCIAHPDTLITQQQYDSIVHSVQQRKEGKPLAYIVGETDFYGRTFVVNESVLIPRPESEQLVTLALTLIKRIECSAQKKEWRGSSLADTCVLPEIHTHVILDCGTGSGCIGVSIAAELQSEHTVHNWRYILTDTSEEALAVAKKNTHAILPHATQECVRLTHGFLFRALHSSMVPSIIVANLPYVSSALCFRDYNTYIYYEPELALKGSLETELTRGTNRNDESTLRAHNTGYDDGTVIIRQLLEASSSFEHSHILLLEADPIQMDTISRIATSYAYTIQGIFHDSFQYPRFFYCAKPQQPVRKPL